MDLKRLVELEEGEAKMDPVKSIVTIWKFFLGGCWFGVFVGVLILFSPFIIWSLIFP